MQKILNYKITSTVIWFLLLSFYIILSYLGNDIIIPSIFASLSLYLFLIYSAIFIIFHFRDRISHLIIWEIVFLFLSFITMLYSPEFSILGGTFYMMIVNFVLVFVFSQMPWNEKWFKKTMNVFVFSCVSLIVLLFLTNNLYDESGRLGENLFGNANILATMLMVGAIYNLWMLFSCERKYKFVYFISVIIIYLGMFLSGGRKYLVAPLIFLVFMVANDSKNDYKKVIKKIMLTLCISVFCFILIMKVPLFYNTIGYRFEGVFALFNDDFDVDGSTEKRMIMIVGGFEEFFNKPFFGHGFDSFKYFNRDFLTGNFYYSHNNYIELLFNYGIVGFLVYYGFYAYLFMKSIKLPKSVYKGFIIGVIVCLLFYDFFAISYTSTPVHFLLFFCLEITNIIDKKSQSRTLEI